MGERKKRRILRWLVWGTAGLFTMGVLFIAAFLATIDWWITPEWLRGELERNASENIGLPVSIEKLDYSLWNGLRLDGIRVGPPEGYTRDVARIETLELRYDLSGIGGENFHLERLAIVRPVVVIETLNGKSNLQKIAENQPPKGPEPPPEPAEPPDRSQPLSPWMVELDQILLDRLSVELAGEGPNATIEGISAALDGRVDPKRLDLHASFTIASQGGQNVRAMLPAPKGEINSVETGLDLAFTATIAARADRGLTLERSGASLRVKLEDFTALGGPALPPTDLAFWAHVSIDPQKDRAGLDDLGLTLNQDRLVEMNLAIDGVVAALKDALGAAEADVTIQTLGLTAGNGRGDVKLAVPAVRLDLEKLEPYAKAFVPGLDTRGVVFLGPVELRGTASKLQAQQFDHLSIALALEQIDATLPLNAAKIRTLSGKIAIASDGGPIRAQGQITAAGVIAGPNAIDTLAFGLDARADSAAFPELGTATVTLSLGAKSVRAPAAQVSGLQAGASVRGKDVVKPDRTGLPPIDALITLKTDRVLSGSGTTAIALSKLDLRVEAKADRLLDPANEPIHAQVGVGLAEVNMKDLNVQRVSLELKAVTPDPRLGKPLDVTADLGATVGAIAAKDTRAENTVLDLDLRANGIDLAAAPGSKNALPSSVALKTTLAVGGVHAVVNGAGDVETPLRLDLKVDAKPREENVTVHSLRFALGELLALRLAGSAKRYGSKEPYVDLHFNLEPIDLAKAKVPKGIAAQVPDLAMSGKLSLDLRAKGTIPPAELLLERLDDPPIEVQGKLQSENLSVRANGLDLEGLSGAIDLALSKGRAGVSGDLRFLRLVTPGNAPLDVRGLALRLDAGLGDRVWLARGAITLDSLRSLRANDVLKNNSIEIDLAYPLFRDLELRRVAIRAPDAGLDLTMKGRLERRRFGVLRPELDLEAGLDFDRMRGAMRVGGGQDLGTTGRMRVKLAAHAPNDQILDLSGALELDRFSYAAPGLSVERASGRLPFEQRLLLPPVAGWGEERSKEEKPKRDQVDALEDLRLRVLDLVAALQERAKLHVDPSDVLVISPRTADYESLRPFYAAGNGAQMSIERITWQSEVARRLNLKPLELRALSFDAMYRSGVVRLDRFALQVWEGDVYGEMAFQIAAEDHLRVRLRSTITDLNLDVPVANALRREPATEDKDLFLVSGNIDLRVDLQERSMSGYLDLSKMGSEMIIAMVDALDPHGVDKQLQDTKAMISTAVSAQGVVGVRLSGVDASIKQNLLNADFRWSSTFYNPLRFVVGSFVINAVKPLRRYSLSPQLENPAIDRLNESIFAGLRGRIARPKDEDDEVVASP